MKNTYQTQIESIQEARESKQALNITGGGSKSFYGEAAVGTPFEVSSNQGIVEYDPAELVIVARAGTSLSEMQSVLAEKGQMLGFEPPFSAQGATMGGVVASGLCGSCRPYKGAVRDYLLGARLINGQAQLLQFGGKVMKNVAGFDLFRPMAGAMGTLGLLVEVSVRVIPVPEQTLSLIFSCASRKQAITHLCALGQSLACLSAAAWLNGEVYLRLSGSRLAINRDRAQLSERFEVRELEGSVWELLSSFEHDFFVNIGDQMRIYCVDLPPAMVDITLPGEQLIEWGGARRYLKTSMAIETVRAAISAMGGAVTLLQREGPGKAKQNFFEPLNPALMAVHQRLKASFDPVGIFNPGRLYPGL